MHESKFAQELDVNKNFEMQCIYIYRKVWVVKFVCREICVWHEGWEMGDHAPASEARTKSGRKKRILKYIWTEKFKL